jgi:mono/diheme cytochrome c family protein
MINTISRFQVALRSLVGCLAFVSSVLSVHLGWTDQPQSDANATKSDSKIEFNRDIRPILSDHCFACHGPDANHREADLRVDTQEGLFGNDGSSGPVVAGDPDHSPLWNRVISEDPDEQMPPSKFGKPLNAEQVALLKRWIEQGAAWQGHWAFQPVRAIVPPLQPATSDASGRDSLALNEVDAFILRALDEQGLTPAPQADKRTLVRRLSFDLLGLPPSMEQVERYQTDDSPEAYERLVDDLLASPHFGERLAMWWLDLVRYADSVGYHGDQPVSVSPFRDYVIQSFNSNKPFDQFTREQLAGDLFPQPSKEQLIASGYNRLGMMSAEGGVQPKEYLAKYVAERVRNLGGAWLGVTLGCCECHDHKYDPFTTEEFYQFEAFFADIQEQGLYAGANWGSEMPVPTAEQASRQTEIEQQIKTVRETLATPTEALVNAQIEWEQSQVNWQVLKPHSLESRAGVTLVTQEDGSILASGKNPANDTYTLIFDKVPAEITAIRIEVLPHASLPKNGPGRAGNGNFVLSELRLAVKKIPVDADSTTEADVSVEGTEEPVPLQNATATYEQVGAAEKHPNGKWAAAAAIDNDANGPTWGWAVMEQAGKPNAAFFETAKRIGGPGQHLIVRLDQNLDNPKHTLGHFRISVTSSPQPINAETVLSPELAEVLQIAPKDRSDAQASQLAAHYRSISPLLEEARKQLKELEQQLEAHRKTIRTTLITARVEPRMIRVLARGNWMDENGKVVQPAFPEVLGGPAPTERRLTRMDLADWVVSPENPLTARVTVNRLWKLFFGNGLSGRLDDLGSQGQWPSHPELLDWLAKRFVDSGWNIKEIVKLMVMSKTYRQASVADDATIERDPNNQWLARQSRFRLDAEIVRDNALAVSGLLVDDVGGQSVKPYQPRGYWAYLNFPQREWENGKAEQLYRRGVYTHWQRQYLHPSLLAFDAPSREECTADRPRSNTPLQALVLLNDPSYVEAARVLAERALNEKVEGDQLRIQWIYSTVLNRSAAESEAQVLAELLTDHRLQYQNDLDSARQLIAIGDKPAAQGVEASELAAWTSVTRAVLNLHETITRN